MASTAITSPWRDLPERFDPWKSAGKRHAVRPPTTTRLPRWRDLRFDAGVHSQRTVVEREFNRFKS